MTASDSPYDPLLVADIEDAFNAVDPITYLIDVINSANPDAADKFYSEAVTGEWDGGEL
jgi:hypothetical protein